MKEKFKNIPVDSDTTIEEEKETQIGKLDALHQKWCWDGIKGESLIFVSEEVAAYSEDELIAECHKTKLMKSNSSVTFKRNENGFTFVNFNFVS